MGILFGMLMIVLLVLRFHEKGKLQEKAAEAQGDMSSFQAQKRNLMREHGLTLSYRNREK
jgi:hypothetical protein